MSDRDSSANILPERYRSAVLKVNATVKILNVEASNVTVGTVQNFSAHNCPRWLLYATRITMVCIWNTKAIAIEALKCLRGREAVESLLNQLVQVCIELQEKLGGTGHMHCFLTSGSVDNMAESSDLV